MDRPTELQKLTANPDTLWDAIVIGGGSTGLGCAVDLASRGFKVALLEKHDFAKCTSSRSTKLVHGGVRYLQKGDIPLVWEALRERGRMRRNAPHLVKDQKFIVSNYSHWDNVLYFLGLTFYDMLSIGFGYGRSRFISRSKVNEYLPTAKTEGLKGGIVYHDGQFDDSRMAISLAQTCIDLGGCAVNYMEVTGLLKADPAQKAAASKAEPPDSSTYRSKLTGVLARDLESGLTYNIKSKLVINATGIFADDIMQLDAPEKRRAIMPSQGTHIVLDKKFLQSDYAIMVPKTSDGRVLFVIPWHERVIIGTTDIPCKTPEAEPKPMKKEIDFILQTASLYLNPAPTRKDIVSVFAGQRPLAAPKEEFTGKTKELSRGHKIIVSRSGLITITGGKWTSYRKMAQDTVNRAMVLGILPTRKCRTKRLRLHESEIDQNPAGYTPERVVCAVRHEMARTVDDVLARRIRIQFTDAAEALRLAPEVAKIMAAELHKDDAWVENQIKEYTEIVKRYIV